MTIIVDRSAPYEKIEFGNGCHVLHFFWLAYSTDSTRDRQFIQEEAKVKPLYVLSIYKEKIQVVFVCYGNH